MEINVNSNNFGNVGMGRGIPETVGTDAGREAENAAKVSRTTSLQVSSLPASGLAGAEPVADVPDAALSRDDALGRMVKAAFGLPPPPMPAFAD